MVSAAAVPLVVAWAAAAAASTPPASTKSFWAFFPKQRCATELLLADSAAGELARQVDSCRAGRSASVCRAACLATRECGGYDTGGRLYTAASCSAPAPRGRVAGRHDLFLRQATPPAEVGGPLPQDKVEHMVVLYMENRPFDHIL
jgi:phospholipase C